MQKIILSIFVLIFSCEKDTITAEDLIINLSTDKTEIVADGNELVRVVAVLNENTDRSFWKVSFSTNSGVFKSSNSSQVEIAANRFPSGLIKAEATLVTSNVPGQIVLTAELEQYEVNTSVDAIPSTPSQIELTANSFSVENDFGSEIQLVGNLKNSSGGKVSRGFQVTFDDFYFGTNHPVNGHFRMIESVSNANSQVSAIYTPGYILPDTTIRITATMITDITVSSDLEIFVIPKED